MNEKQVIKTQVRGNDKLKEKKEWQENKKKQKEEHKEHGR